MAREKKVGEQQSIEAAPEGEHEVMVDTLPIVGKCPANEKEEKFLREVIEYEFYNSEEPGHTVSFTYGSTKNKKVFEFIHGQKYKLPRHVARHVESCSTPLYKHEPDGSGIIRKKRVGTKTRFQLRPVFE